jgi:hypothetical protein
LNVSMKLIWKADKCWLLIQIHVSSVYILKENILTF